MRYTWLLALGLSATLTFAACGGDDGGDSSSGGDSGSTSSGSSSSGSSGSGSPASGATSSNKADDNMPADFKKAMENQAKKNFTATFTLSGGGGMNADIKVAQKGDKAMYTAMSLAGQGEFISITQGDTSYSCMKVAAMAGTCEKIGTNGSMGGTMGFSVDNVVEDLESAATYKKIADKNVNGRDSQCWEVSDPEKLTVCVGKKDGVMTLVESPDFKMELKEFAGSVDDKLFTPPFPVK